MPASLTIFCRKLSMAGALERLRGSAGAPLKVEGDPASWTRMVIQGPETTLTFNAMLRERSGDEFSDLILGAESFFRKVDTDAPDRKKTVLDWIAATELIVGVTASPEFVEEEGHFDLVLDLAEELDGLIFNGSGMVTSEGDLLLDNAGAHD
ncbi:MAG: hypothetical protein ACRD4P_08310 [Bryobacteraceae bacterium]